MAGMYGCFKGKNSDSGAMASGAPDVTTNQEAAEVAEECSGKKKSKFQTFKKFFARKKKKEASSSGADAELKASQSSDNVSKTSENNTLTRAEKDKGSGSKISLGSKALSHDSVFVSDSSEANEALGASQDSIHGKVKSLQLQLKQAIKLGSPPSLMCVKRTEDAGTMSEDDGLPCSPPEYTSPHTAVSQPQRNSSISMEVTDSDEDQLSSRAMSPLLAVPGDFSQPASPFGCLDNSAAKHKLGLRQKACNRRKPANRMEIKAEVDPVVKEILKESSPEAVEEPEEQKATDASVDKQKPKVDKEEAAEEEEEEDEEEEKAQTQHSRGSLLIDKQESEEGEDGSDAEQDVSHAPDASSSPEPCLSEEEAADGPPPALSHPTSAAPSSDSPRASPEPPAGQIEYLMDPPGIAYGTERSGDGSELILGGEEEEEEEEEAAEEESSFLQEVLSSLKTPLSSCALSLEKEDGEEAKEKETEGQEPVSFHEAPSGSLLLGQTNEEEEEDSTLRVSSPSSLDEDEEEEEEVVERFNQHSDTDEREEAEEPEEEHDLLQAKPDTTVDEEERENARSEGEEQAIELEAEEEEREVEAECEEEEVEEVMERVEEAEEAMEEEDDRTEEMTETVSDEEEEEVNDVTPTPDDGADMATGEETVCMRQQSIRTEVEPDEEEPAAAQESKAASIHLSVHDDEEQAEEEEDFKQSEQRDDEEAQQAEADEDMEQENAEPDHVEEHQTSLSKLPPLSLPEPQSEHQSEPTEPITPSKSGTTVLHINLVSPSSEKPPPSFQLPPTPEASPTPAAAQEDTAEEEVEEEGRKQQVEEEEEEEAPPAEEAAKQPDQSRARFTVAPAWQRSLSDAKEDPPAHGSAPSPAGEEGAAAAKADPAPKPTAKPQIGVASPEPPKAAEESSSAVEANSDNPFGVRLRRTSALHRFGSEEESSEAPAEPPAQPTNCKVESPPVSVKPSISQPISSKPALPKKPEILAESGAKNKRISDTAAVRGVSSGSDSPSWISVAKQKQKIYKENSLDEITVKKEEQERKSSLPMYVSSAASKEHNNKTLESPGKASMLELSKPSSPPEKEPRRALSTPTPVPPQLPKSQAPPCPVAPKPQPPPAPAKHPAQHAPSHKPLSPPTPVPPKPCTSPPPSLPKTAAPPLTSPPFSQRTAPPQPAPKPQALSGQTPSSQRGPPSTALPQDEPPWMALAKKKAKAWSEMPQIVQ